MSEECVYVLIGFRQELIDAEFTIYRLDQKYTDAYQAGDEKLKKKLKKKKEKFRASDKFHYFLMGPTNCGIFKDKVDALNAVIRHGDTNYGCYPYYLIERHHFGYDACDFSAEAETWLQRKKDKTDDDIVYHYEVTTKPECYKRTAVFM